jgi:hypothetical protein
MQNFLHYQKHFNFFTKNFLVLIFFVTTISAFGQNQRFTASGNFTVPAGITKITVACWGGGGGGGAATGTVSGGGGGAGGAYARKELTVTPGQVIAVTVGIGGTAGVAAAGGAGGASYVLNTSTVFAQGGAGGNLGSTANSSASGAAGSSGSSVGDIVRAGGNGGTGSTGASAGGGGEAGGISANGNSGTSTSGGAGLFDAGDGGAPGAVAGGNGANGAASNGGNTTAIAQAASGGGGGGGHANNATDRNGGAGAPGEVRIYWCTAAPALPELTSVQNSQTTADLNISVCPGTIVGGGGQNDFEIFNNATWASDLANGYTYAWEVSGSINNGPFSAWVPAVNSIFPLTFQAGACI